MSAVSKAPGTRTTGDPLVPHCRYRVSKAPARIMRSPDGRVTRPLVARLYAKLAAVRMAASTTSAAAAGQNRRRMSRLSRGLSGSGPSAGGGTLGFWHGHVVMPGRGKPPAGL